MPATVADDGWPKANLHDFRFQSPASASLHNYGTSEQ